MAEYIKKAFFEGYKFRYKTYSEEGAWRESQSYVVYESLLTNAIDDQVGAGW